MDKPEYGEKREHIQDSVQSSLEMDKSKAHRNADKFGGPKPPPMSIVNNTLAWLLTAAILGPLLIIWWRWALGY